MVDAYEPTLNDALSFLKATNRLQLLEGWAKKRTDECFSELPCVGRASVIYADPPWRYNIRKGVQGANCSPPF